MAHVPQNRTEMLRLLREATTLPDPVDPINDEHLVLLAEGRLDELAEPDRDQLLRHVAADPETARLLCELRAVGIGQEASQSSPLVFVTRLACALAACLVVALGIWRLTDPPRLAATSDGQVTILRRDGAAPDWWDQVDRQRLHERYEREQLRDYALFAACGACFVLAIPVVWHLMGRRNRD